MSSTLCRPSLATVRPCLHCCAATPDRARGPHRGRGRIAHPAPVLRLPSRRAMPTPPHCHMHVRPPRPRPAATPAPGLRPCAIEWQCALTMATSQAPWTHQGNTLRCGGCRASVACSPWCQRVILALQPSMSHCHCPVVHLAAAAQPNCRTWQAVPSWGGERKGKRKKGKKKRKENLLILHKGLCISGKLRACYCKFIFLQYTLAKIMFLRCLIANFALIICNAFITFN